MKSKYNDYMDRKLSGLNHWLRYHKALANGYSIHSVEDLCDSSMCSRCKGECCKHYPCVYATTDFLKVNEKNLRLVLDTGIVTVSFSHFKNDKRFFLIRPMALSDAGAVASNDYVTRSQDNRCRMYGEKGCMLDPDCRPASGLLLLPQHGCVEYYKASDQEYDWEHYQDLLSKLYVDYKKVIVPDGTKSANEKEVKQLQKVLRGEI